MQPINCNQHNWQSGSQWYTSLMVKSISVSPLAFWMTPLTSLTHASMLLVKAQGDTGGPMCWNGERAISFYGTCLTVLINKYAHDTGSITFGLKYGLIKQHSSGMSDTKFTELFITIIYFLGNAVNVVHLCHPLTIGNSPSRGVQTHLLITNSSWYSFKCWWSKCVLIWSFLTWPVND